ncbi:MAG TPA: DUF1311 domain-containing protein [bacterium]|nr:DUF1311 domain-containing protein [bacterium]
MMGRFYAGVLLLMMFACSDSGFCQETAAQIDSALARWIELSDGSTAGVRFCFSTGIEKMDQRLNALYRSLLEKLNEEQKALLRDSQRKWLAFREAEAKLALAVDPNAGGSLALIAADSFQFEMLKKWVRDFETYLSQENLRSGKNGKAGL